MPGTRSVISFFAGLSELNIKRTVILASISAFIWNAIILYLGVIFGDNIDVVDKYLSTYSNVGLIITGLVVLFFVIRYFVLKNKAKN
jgi:membrane protein DedA with SNARE-associated domain